MMTSTREQPCGARARVRIAALGERAQDIFRFGRFAEMSEADGPIEACLRREGSVGEAREVAVPSCESAGVVGAREMQLMRGAVGGDVRGE